MLNKTATPQTVLVVDDEPMVRDLAVRVLRQRGYRVLEAADGMEALEVAAAYRKPIHLLLSDLRMPRMGGSELSRRMKDYRPEIMTLFMSGNAHAGLGPDAAFLPKPFTIQALVAKVEQVLNPNAAAQTA